MVRNLVKRYLLKRGIVLSRPPGQFVLTEVKLANAKRRGLEIRSAIDGGAARGDWARALKQIYPEARILCVEPRDDEEPALNAVTAELPGIEVARTLLGPAQGQVQFTVSGDQSSALPDSRGANFGQKVTMAMVPLDELVAERKFPGPDMIKLDLQGYELEALRGATQCLVRAQALLLELSFHRMQCNQPLAEEVIAFVREHGFRIYDIPGLWHRPLDGALAQGDFLFIKEGHPLLADERWDRSAD